MTSRIPFMVLALLSLLTGLWTGLVRMGWYLPVTDAVAHHGGIMVGGFLGTLIILEKVIPLRRKILFGIPLLTAGAVVAFFFGEPFISMILMIGGSVGAIILFALYLRIHFERTMVLMLLGACCWLVGNMMLLQTKFYPSAFPWWMGFLVFTITSERLELSKFLPISKKQYTLLFIFLTVFVMGLLIPFHSFGRIVSGVALVGIAVWLLRFDMIRISIKKKELTRFTAVALLMGYVALLLTGVFLITLSNELFAYDVIVHMFFIGFVFAMIFAHGPIILPGVLGISAKPYHPVLYLWLIVLQNSLILRIFSDVLFSPVWKKISGLTTAAGILLYFLTLVILVVGQRKYSASK